MKTCVFLVCKRMYNCVLQMRHIFHISGLRYRSRLMSSCARTRNTECTCVNLNTSDCFSHCSETNIVIDTAFQEHLTCTTALQLATGWRCNFANWKHALSGLAVNWKHVLHDAWCFLVFTKYVRFYDLVSKSRKYSFLAQINVVLKIRATNPCGKYTA